MGKNNWKLEKEQRIQLKVFISCLGLILLGILLAGQLFAALMKEEEPKEEMPIPVVESLCNVWIMEVDDNGILIFRDGKEERYSCRVATSADMREQVADIVLTDGMVTEVRVKTEKINGRILSADASGVDVEGYGKLPLADNYRGYRIYNTLRMCNSSDLYIGYDFADLVIEDGEICGILLAKEEAMEAIRVLIKSGDYAGLLHEHVVLSSDSDFTITYGTHDNLMREIHKAGDEITIDTESSYFVGERVTIMPNVLTGKIALENVSRSYGIPSYRGQIELLKTADGIAVVNQVSLEEYLYCVVPSEMPASYPGEALKAQAICARTYAYGHMLQAGYPQYGAHVDDSTSYQVYNNIMEQESTTTAVKETYGQLLYTEYDTLAGTYYYSTSCGVGSDARVWKTQAAQSIDYLNGKAISQADGEEKSQDDNEIPFSEQLQEEDAFARFICSKNIDDFEVTEGWYRWTYQVPCLSAERIYSAMQKRYLANEKLVLTWENEEFVSKPIEEFQEVRELFISKRGEGGIADELVLVTEKERYLIISEHNIRYVLNDGECKILRQDGSEVNSPSLLPSAFFTITLAREKDKVVGYTLTGGGFGHGVGMSQNAAKHMAKAGYTSADILMFFYDNCQIRNVYEK